MVEALACVHCIFGAVVLFATAAADCQPALLCQASDDVLVVGWLLGMLGRGGYWRPRSHLRGGRHVRDRRRCVLSRGACVGHEVHLDRQSGFGYATDQILQDPADMIFRSCEHGGLESIRSALLLLESGIDHVVNGSILINGSRT